MRLYGGNVVTTAENGKRRKNKGKLEFHPTQEQRDYVERMAGFRMSLEEMSFVIRNPETGEPINRDTLAKAFAAEIAGGKARLKGMLVKRYVEKVQDGDWPAIQAGLRQYFKWKDNASDVEANVALPLEQLVETLARQAQTLGLHIDLSYKFHDPKLIEGTVNKPEGEK